MENIPINAIENRIFTIRGKQVMLDRDLAAVYDVSTTRLNEQVSRNLRRFPETFCFYLTNEELKFWISQNATSKAIKIGLRKPPRVFTEYGVAMVSSILNSQRAEENFEEVTYSRSRNFFLATFSTFTAICRQL